MGIKRNIIFARNVAKGDLGGGGPRTEKKKNLTLYVKRLKERYPYLWQTEMGECLKHLRTLNKLSVLLKTTSDKGLSIHQMLYRTCPEAVAELINTTKDPKILAKVIIKGGVDGFCIYNGRIKNKEVMVKLANAFGVKINDNPNGAVVMLEAWRKSVRETQDFVG